VRVEALTDYGRGVTVNVGTFRGGTKRNVVPEHADAWVDVRYDDPTLGEEVRAAIEKIASTPFVDGTSTALWGQLHRPPKIETPEVAALLELHAEVARDLGIDLPPPVHAGGGTDGSLAGAQSLPTLDSMGAVGGGAHTSGEYLSLESLPERTTAAALLLRRLMRRKIPPREALPARSSSR
jgi:glutamate carboxypeptidase